MFCFSEVNECVLISPPAIQFVLSDEFSHMRPEERQQLLHVRTCVSRLSLAGHTVHHSLPYSATTLYTVGPVTHTIHDIDQMKC